jgi:hypothetical protein
MRRSAAAGKVEAVSYEVGKMLTALLKKLQPMP